MKVFKNERTENNNELPIRKGAVVPDGAVNLAWHKAPDLNPKNNLVVIDSTKTEGPEKSGKFLAYADLLGILEDEYGNQAWPEEFPIVGNKFNKGNISTAASFLPYVHISRYFHIDYAGLAYFGSTSKLSGQPEVKVIDGNGAEYLDPDGNPKYEIHISSVPITLSDDSREAAYRLWVFLDTDPEEDDLYVTYHKVEIENGTNLLKNEQLGYKEPLNAKEYYAYLPEETEVIDHRSNSRDVFSTKPIDLKDQVIGKTQPNYKGWRIQVPKKAIPDPRNFELFRWRLACEYSRQIDPDESDNNNTATKINAGVVTFNSIGPGQSRANYLFLQLNESSFNTGGINFVNPLNEQGGSVDNDKQSAAYWQVPIQNTSLEDLSKFDVLVWAPSSSTIDLTDSVLQKIEYFVETLGGTFILETSSRMNFVGLSSLGFSTKLRNLLDTTANRAMVSTAAYYDYQPATPNSNTMGSWQTWPPRLEDQFTNNAHSADLIQNLNFLGGWDLDSIQELKPTAYKNSSAVANLSLQYITGVNETDWDIIVDAKHIANVTRHPILIRQKNSSGGSLIVSTGCFFEDHVLDATSSILSSTYQVENISQMPAEARENFFLAADSTNMEGELKLRVNLAMLSTAFRPPTNLSTSAEDGYNTDAERHSITLYSDWESSWVINAHNNVLDSEEKAKYNFALLPKSPDNPDPVWMRFLSNKTAGEIMDQKARESRPDIENFSDWNKRYTMLITNPNVETFSYNLISDDTVPVAWTYSFSPPFIVPEDLGPHVIREETIAGIGVGEGKRIYPSKPFKVRSTASYVTNEVESHSTQVTAKFNGEVKKVYSIPPKTVTNTVTVVNPAYRAAYYADRLLRWSTDQNTTLINNPFPPYSGVPQPIGIANWTDNHYARGYVNNWAHWGHNGTYSQNGNHVIGPNRSLMIQKLLNQFVFFGIIPGPYLAEDGYFGNVTAWKVISFQQARGAIYVDGIVDAETWSLLGRTLLSLQKVPDWRSAVAGSDLGYWGSQAEQFLEMQNMSSGNNRSYFKQSWYRNGPSSISEGFVFNFNPAYSSSSNGSGSFSVYEVWIKPTDDVYSNSTGVVIDWLDVGTDLWIPGYTFSNGYPGSISRWAPDGQYLSIPFSKRDANSVIFKVTQSTAAGWGTARSFGIEDVAVLAQVYVPANGSPTTTTTVTTTIPGSTVIETLNVEFEYVFTLKSGIPQKVPSIVKNGTLVNDVKIISVNGNHSSELDLYPSSITEVRLTSYEITPAYKAPSVTVTPYNETVGGTTVKQSYSLVYNNTLQTISEPNFIAGPKVGDGSANFYVKSLGGQVEPFARSFGWVNKEQGVLLITDATGRPFGFPAATPTASAISSNSVSEATFVRLTMDSWDTDQTLTYGFYDTLRKEWLENRNGEPDISYYNYVRRGVQNVYMAVQTTYEIDGQSNLPPATDPVLRPFKLAMPVYGVKTRNEGSIKLRNPSVELGHNDVWPVLVSTGSFSKQYTISKELANSSTTFIKDYPGRTLTAHYLLREGTQGPWSDLLGRPYKDTADERPRLLSDDTFIVNNAPIASRQEPTLYSGPSDPVTPFFTVYRRETFNGVWNQVPLSDIKEYNLNKGIITLKTPLADQDNRLVKVSYTSRDYTHHYKYDSTQKINLNPYIMRVLKDQADHITALEQPLYVYIKPSFVVEDDTKEVVAETHDNKIINITTSNTIFDPRQADYDPLAYRLGIIFVTTTMDISELNILDTRVRGGGLKHHLEISELGKEVKSYWDTPAGEPYAYQQGGFVIVRLPGVITQDFATEEDLRKVIDRNITAGVVYELQDYNGEPLMDFTGSY